MQALLRAGTSRDSPRLRQHTLPAPEDSRAVSAPVTRSPIDLRELAQRARSAMQRGCALHRPACQASTSGAGRVQAPSVSSFAQPHPRSAAPRQAAAAPARQPSLAPPLVIDTGEFRCPACTAHPQALAPTCPHAAALSVAPHGCFFSILLALRGCKWCV